MNKSEAQQSIKKINNESGKLNPSAKIIFYEIDATDLALDLSIVTDGEVNSDPNSNILRFHNNYKLFSKNLIWQGDIYNVAPIAEDGFEINSTGTSPQPKLSISIEENSGLEPLLGKLRNKIDQLNGLVGAKVTRKSTFVKYLDGQNFIDILPPEDFDPDPNAYFPDDVFYIDRKSKDSKNIIELELTSLIDLKGLKLPNSIVSATKCRFNYRGAGCLYEYNSRRNVHQHGSTSESKLPNSAISVTNDRNELITDILKNKTGHTATTSIKDRGEWKKGLTYNLGDQVFITKSNINYYFVCSADALNIPPPNSTYWIADQCSGTTRGCQFRWGRINQGFLRIGSFAGTDKIS